MSYALTASATLKVLPEKAGTDAPWTTEPKRKSAISLSETETFAESVFMKTPTELCTPEPGPVMRLPAIVTVPERSPPVLPRRTAIAPLPFAIVPVAAIRLFVTERPFAT